MNRGLNIANGFSQQERFFRQYDDYFAPGKRPQFEIVPSFLSPEPTEEQKQAVHQVFYFLRLDSSSSFEAWETKRKCMRLAAMIFENRLPNHLFTAENLVFFSSFCDAFLKPGFIWQNVLKTEAEFIISDLPHFEVDLEEYMLSFRQLFSNFHKLSCAYALTLGLFLLFFHRLMLTPQGNSISWNTVVGDILDRSLPAFFQL